MTFHDYSIFKSVNVYLTSLQYTSILHLYYYIYIYIFYQNHRVTFGAPTSPTEITLAAEVTNRWGVSASLVVQATSDIPLCCLVNGDP